MGREGEGNLDNINFKISESESNSDEENGEALKEASIDRPLLTAFYERFSAYDPTHIADSLRREHFKIPLTDDNGKELMFEANYQSVCNALERTRGTAENEKAIDILEKAFAAITNEVENFLTDKKESLTATFDQIKKQTSDTLDPLKLMIEAAGQGSKFDEQLNAFYERIKPMYESRVGGMDQ